MGKRNIAKIVVPALMFCIMSSFAYADIQWLPKYQAKFAQKRTVDSDNPLKADPLSCEAKGWLSEIPASQTCSPKYLVGGKKCWSDCKCEAKYKYASGKGVANGCPNGKTVDNKDSCGGLYSACVDCSTNTQVSAGWGTTYKSGANVAVMSNFGTCANYYYSCNSGYTPARAASNAYLHSGPWTWISCASNQKAVNQDGSTGTPKLCQKCMPKVCADYNKDYVTANDPTKACTKINSSDVGGLECWSCVACSSDYKYDTTNCPAPKIIGTDKCAGKASTCSCPATVTCGTGLSCKTQAPSGCTGCLECNTCPFNGTLTSCESTWDCTYEECSNKYILNCKNEGMLTACPTGYVCKYEECSKKYYITGCATGNINIAKNTWYGCWMRRLAK